MFLKASRVKLRFATVKGTASVEDLWELPLTQLKALYKGYKTAMKEQDDEEDEFLSPISKKDVELELRFEIVKTIIRTRMDEAAALKNSKVKKEELSELDTLIKAKELEAKGNMSLAELQALRDKKASE